MPFTFSGKRYRRVRWENIDNLINAKDANPAAVYVLKKCNAPILSYKEIDDKRVELSLEWGGRTSVINFTLGEDAEFSKPDGSKIKIKYTLEGNNVLNKHIIMPEGKVSNFRKEFKEDGAKMTVTVGDSAEVQATIYYEVVK